MVEALPIGSIKTLSLKRILDDIAWYALTCRRMEESTTNVRNMTNQQIDQAGEDVKATGARVAFNETDGGIVFTERRTVVKQSDTIEAKPLVIRSGQRNSNIAGASVKKSSKSKSRNLIVSLENPIVCYFIQLMKTTLWKEVERCQKRKCNRNSWSFQNWKLC